MKIPVPIRLGILLPAAILSACSSLAKQVYVASDTSLGVNGAVNTAQTAGKLVIGYDRKFVAYVPKVKYEGVSDAMAVYNCTHVEVEGLRITMFRERLATGDAAKLRSGKGGDTNAARPGCNPGQKQSNNSGDSSASAESEGGNHAN